MNIIWPKALLTTNTGRTAPPDNPTFLVTRPRTELLILTLQATAVGNLGNLRGWNPPHRLLPGNNSMTFSFYLLNLPFNVVTLCKVRPAGLRLVFSMVITQQLCFAAVRTDPSLLSLTGPQADLEPKPLTIRTLLPSLCTIKLIAAALFGPTAKKASRDNMLLPVR